MTQFARTFRRLAFPTASVALGFALLSSCSQSALDAPGGDDTGGVSTGGTAGTPNGGAAGTSAGLGGGPNGGTGGTTAPTGGIGATAGAPTGGVAGSALGGAAGLGGAPLGGTSGAAGSGANGGTGGGASGAAGTAGSAAGGAGGIGGAGGTGGAAGGKGGSGGTGGGKASTEDDGADCQVPALPAAASLPTNAKLPDPFKKLDGTRMTTKAEWRCRREEIKKQAEAYAYGTKPARPQMVTGTVSSTNITVNVTDMGRNSTFSAPVSLPGTGTGPYPVIVVLGGLGADTATIRSEGVATINYDPYSVGAENTGRANKQGAFYTIYGSNSTTGLLVAWAWGVSRIIDVIEASGGTILKADAVGVTGCSRFGKGAFTVGVFDQRIALTMPIESGTAGVPIWRGIPGEGAQTLSSAYGEQPWFGDAFSAFTGSPTKAPIDTHELVAMIAPRGLFIMENPHIANLGPKSGHVAALGGAEVYKALGAGDNITYYSNVQNGTHCSMRPEWTTPLRNNIQKFLKKTGNVAGTINPSASATGRLSDWSDWTTPTLN